MNSGHAAISYAKRIFAIDNGDGFSLHSLKTCMLLRSFPTGVAVKRYPKQVGLGENDDIVVGGSDHGAVYVFDRETGCPLDLLRHSDRGLVQTITVRIIFSSNSQMIDEMSTDSLQREPPHDCHCDIEPLEYGRGDNMHVGI